MQTTFLDEMRIEIMRFTLQLRKKNIEDCKYNKATDFSKSNIGASL